MNEEMKQICVVWNGLEIAIHCCDVQIKLLTGNNIMNKSVFRAHMIYPFLEIFK